MNKRAHVFYNGRVQGVGFRFTTEEIANELGILGWIKNLRSGEVELVVEAPQEKLEVFLSRLDQYFSTYIQDAQVSWQEATGSFKGFEIRF